MIYILIAILSIILIIFYITKNDQKITKNNQKIIENYWSPKDTIDDVIDVMKDPFINTLDKFSKKVKESFEKGVNDIPNVINEIKSGLEKLKVIPEFIEDIFT